MVQAEALVVREGGAGMFWEDVELSGLQSEELLIAVKACGICHADLKAAAGTFAMKPPMIVGHEGVGIVEGVGSGAAKQYAVGDYVVLSLGYCGKCDPCLSGHPSYCSSIFQCNYKGTRTSDDSYVAHATSDNKPIGAQFFGHSSMATRAVVRMECAIKVLVDDVGELRKFAGMGCGFQTGCGAIMNVAKPQADDVLLIFGCGAVGLTAIMSASITPCKNIVAIDNVLAKCDLAMKFGATHSIIPTKQDVVAEVRKLTNGKMATIAIDCVGHLGILQTGHDCLAALGTLITIGNVAGATPPFTIISHMLKGISYVGVHQGDSNPHKFIPELIQLHAEGKLPFESIQTQYRKDELSKAFADLESGKVVKPVIVFD